MDLVALAEQILNQVKESGGNRIYSALDLKKTKSDLSSATEQRSDVKLLKGKIERLHKRANESLVEAITAFAKTIELKDRYTGEHTEKTVHHATEIARALDLSREEIELVRQAAVLHDLGKIGISEKILLKKDKLTKKEFEQIKKHPQIGADIIRPIHFLHALIPLIFYHHERWDGQGYPSGLKAEEIPIGARIIAIADVYQALISDRPYRKAYSKAEAIRIIKEGSGTQFDPGVVSALLKILQKER
jgi:HD-GYP domain-containing protein (c-di-GMP phosphodiesterase class II)